MLAPWIESYDQPRQLTKKHRHYFANKGPSSQSYGFSSSHVWMWELDYKELWAPRIDAFELWCWRRLLRIPWTARRPNQSILKEISPEYSLEWLMLKLKLQWFGYRCKEVTHLKRPWCWERLGAGRGGDDRGWDGWMASWTQWTRVWVGSKSWWWTGREAWHCSPWGHKELDTTEQLNWTDKITYDFCLYCPHTPCCFPFVPQNLCCSFLLSFLSSFGDQKAFSLCVTPNISSAKPSVNSSFYSHLPKVVSKHWT